LAGRKGGTPGQTRLLGLAVPILFGLFIFIVWEWVTIGFGVPSVLMPAPSTILAALVRFAPTLAADFVQTFVKSVLVGWALGSALGFLVAIVADAVPFLRRGLLPLGN